MKIRILFMIIFALMLILTLTACSTDNNEMKTESISSFFDQTPELSALLAKMEGEWVDDAFYNSTVIDESVVYPLEFAVGVYQDGALYFFTDCRAQRPFGPVTWGGTGGPDAIHSLLMKKLENGLVELTVDQSFIIGEGWWTYPEKFLDHRIIIDPSLTNINNVIYYIGDTKHTMVRFDESRDATRYYADMTDDGHIRLSYVVGRWGFSSRSEYGAKIYRSIEEGERGELFFSDISVDMLFTFTDSSAEPGQTYYYSIWDDSWGYEFALIIGGEWQMVVDVDVVKG
jgi:hypothetical protein